MPDVTVAEVVDAVSSKADEVRERLAAKREELEAKRAERVNVETVEAEVQVVERLLSEEARIDADLAYEARARHIQEQGRLQREARARGEDYKVEAFPEDLNTPPDNASVPAEAAAPTPPSLSSILQPSLFDQAEKNDSDKSDTEE